MKFVFNKKMVQKIGFILCCLINQSLFGQVLDDLKFDDIVHDFGKVHEADLEVSHMFKFQNISTTALVITKVETSCGCTTPTWSKDTIPPGGIGFVRAIFSTEGKSGDFQKYLYVYVNRPDYFATLSIKGNVIPRPMPNYEKQTFKLNYGNLAFSDNVANFGMILNTEVKEKTIRIFNYNDYPIHILAIDEKPDFIEVILRDSIIKAGDSTTITLKAIGEKITAVGDAYNRISIQTDDEAFPQKFLFVMTKMKENFTNYSKKQLKNAPKLKLSRGPRIDLGSKHLGSKFTESVTISNTGKSDLVIRKLAPSCSCITVSKNSFVIKPGESANVTFTYDTVNQAVASHSKLVNLICNDPTNPEFNFTFLVKIIQ